MMKRLHGLRLITLLFALSLCAPLGVRAADPSVSDILTSAGTRLNETETMAFRMEIDGTTFVDDAETIQLLGAEGVMERPDKVDVTFTAEVLGRQQISIRMITIGDKSWITDIVTGKWVPAPPEFGYNPAVLYDTERGLGPLMDTLIDPQLQGTETINGREAWHITARANGEDTEPLTSGTMRGSKQQVEVWVDTETNDMLQVKISEPADEDINDPATWTLILSDHNKDVKIEAPAD